MAAVARPSGVPATNGAAATNGVVTNGVVTNGAVANGAKAHTRRQARAHQPARLGRLLFHTAAAAYMAYAYLQLGTLFEKVHAPSTVEYGGDLQFLTIWGFILCQLTLVVSAMADIVPESWMLHATKRVLALAALPLEVVVSSIYWPLLLVLPALILPPRPEMHAAHAEPAAAATATPDALFFIPLWMDIGLHLVPTVALIIDFFCLEKKYRPPTSTRTALLVAAALGVSYGTWAEHAASINGKFPYPFLTIISFQARCGVYAGATLFAFVVFRALNALHK